MDELVNNLKEYFKNIKYSVYVCDRCGHAVGHQCIYCSKCGSKMRYHKNISQYELGLLNNEIFEWNLWTDFMIFTKINQELIQSSGIDLTDIREYKKLLVLVKE